MKIAFVFSGVLKYIDETKDYWLNLKNKYNADIYGSFWDIYNNNDNISNFINIYKPIEYEVESVNISKNLIDSIMSNILSPSMWSNRLKEDEDKFIKGNTISMFYKIWRGNNLTKINNINYDIVVRIRTDVVFKDSDIEFIINDYINIPNGITGIFSWKNNWGFSDFFAYGNPKLMDYYSSLIFYYLQYIKDGMYPYPPEHVLRYHLNQKNINVRLFNDLISVQRENYYEVFNRYIDLTKPEQIHNLSPDNLLGSGTSFYNNNKII